MKFWKSRPEFPLEEMFNESHTTGNPLPQRQITGTAAMYDIARIGGFIADKLGCEEEKSWLSSLRDSLYRAFQRHFFDHEEVTFGNYPEAGPWGSDVEDAFAMGSDLVPEEYCEELVSRVVKGIRARDHELISGFMSVDKLLAMLADYHYADDAYEILARPVSYNIGTMLDFSPDGMSEWLYLNGNERSTDPDNFPEFPRSTCHPTWTPIARWFYYGLGGIRPKIGSPGFKRFTLAPQVPQAMKFAKVIHESPYGMILSEWEREGEKVTWKVIIPPNSIASALIPGTEESININGKNVLKSGLKMSGMLRGTAFIELPAGEYHIEF
jgi:alpha-L-rhamnosidase